MYGLDRTVDGAALLVQLSVVDGLAFLADAIQVLRAQTKNRRLGEGVRRREATDGEFLKKKKRITNLLYITLCTQ